MSVQMWRAPFTSVGRRQIVYTGSLSDVEAFCGLLRFALRCGCSVVVEERR